MARYLFNLPDVQPSQKVRVDTASGSDSPATGLTTVTGDAISSTLTGNHGGELPEILGPDGVTTLYLKNLTYSGTVTGSPVTVPGYNQTPVLPGNAAYPTMAAGLRYGPRVVALGDSITVTNSDPTNNISGDSWPTYFGIASGGRAHVVRNAGVSGNTTAQMLARFDTDVTAYAPDVVVIFGGTNNLGLADPMGQTKADITAMVAKALTAGIRPVLATIPPQGTAAISAPGAPTLVGSTSGGTLAAATHTYSITALNGIGETTGGSTANVTTTGSTSSVAVTWAPVAGATGYSIYRNDSGTWGKVGTVGAINGGSWAPLLSFTDTGFALGATNPVSNTTAQGYTGSNETNIPKINRWVKRYARANHLDCLDFYSQCINYSDGRWITGTTRDGTHPTPKQSRVMGVYAWNQLAPLWSQSAPMLVGDNADPTNMLSNGLFVNNNGSVPTGWGSSGGGTGTDTVGTVSGFNGQAFTTASSLGTRLHTGPAVSTGFSVGDTIAFACAVQTSGLDTSGAQVNVQVKCTGSAGYVANAQISSDVGPGVLVGEFVVPTGTTALEPDQHIYNGTSAGSVITGQWTLVNLTTGNVLTP